MKHIYQSKFQLWGLIPNGIWDEDILTAHTIRSEFYLDVQRKDHEFREKTLKPFAKIVTKIIDDLRDESNQNNYEINSKINKATEFYQKNLLESEEQIKNL